MATSAATQRNPLSLLADWLVSALVFVGETWWLALRALAMIFRGRARFRETLIQMASIGADALPIVALITVSTGGVFAFYTAPLFVRFGGTNFVGGTLTLSFLLELGPLLAGITVAARSGAAIAAEIGSMAVTEQLDALRSLGVSPVRYLVVPRLLACVVMMPIVGLVADAAGVMGAATMSAAGGVTPQAFQESVRTYVSQMDLAKGLIKTLWFGFTIATVACHQGLCTVGGAMGVGKATTRSVVLCVVLIFLSDFFLARVLSGATVSGG
jgi:phospholipid/cholesterol/gamma-HCH transport system permease protein